jgi:hypothetical protein
MHTRETMEIDRPQQEQSQGSSADNVAAFIPRLWMVMIPFSIPFLIMTFNFFVVMERTGTIGAIVADTLMPAINIAYVALIFILKSRKI